MTPITPELKAYLDEWKAEHKRIFDELLDALHRPATKLCAADHDNSTPAVNTADCVVGPVTASSDTTGLVTASEGLADPPALVPTAEKSVVIPAVPVDSSTVAPAFCSTECPSRDATEPATAFTPATAARSLTATVDAIPLLAATAAIEGTLDGQAISGVASTSATCSMVCLPRYPASSPLTPTKTSCSQRITSKVPVHRPMPWPSFMSVHADGDGTRPLPWPSLACDIGAVQRESCSPFEDRSPLSIWLMLNGNRSTSYGVIIGNVLCSPSAIWCWEILLLWFQRCLSDLHCVQQANEYFEVSPDLERHIAGISLNMLVTVSVTNVRPVGYASRFLRSHIVKEEVQRGPCLCEVILGAIASGPDYFRWEIAWVLVVSSCAHTDLGGSGNLIMSCIPFSSLPQAKPADGHGTNGLMDHHSMLGFLILYVPVTWPHFSMVQITELTSKDISFQPDSMSSVDRLLLWRLVQLMYVPSRPSDALDCTGGVVSPRLPILPAPIPKPPWLLHGHEPSTSHAMVLMLCLNMLTPLLCLRILVSTTSGLQSWFGSVIDSAVKHGPFLQYAAEWLTSLSDPGQYSVIVSMRTYTTCGNAEVQGAMELMDIPAHWQFLRKEEFARSEKYASDNLTIEGKRFLITWSLTSIYGCNAAAVQSSKETMYSELVCYYLVFKGMDVRDMQLLLWFDIAIFSGTCDADKVQSSRKFTSSNQLQEGTYIKGEHLNYPGVKRNIHDASHHGGEDNGLARASHIWLVAWIVDDLEFSAGCGQGHFQGGTNVILAVFSDQVHVSCDYYIACANQISVDYEYYLDQAYYVDTFCSDIISYREDYHGDSSKTKEVHMPWDPGKSSFKHTTSKLRLGDKPNFREGGMLGPSPYTRLIGLCHGLATSGLGPAHRKLQIDTYKYPTRDDEEAIQTDQKRHGGGTFSPTLALFSLPLHARSYV